MKIVYCLNSISEPGGIATVTMAKANALAEIPGNEVFLCVTDHKDNGLSKRLSSNVTLIDLNIDYYEDDWKSKWHVLKGVVVKRRKHKKALKKTFDEIRPDIVVSVGQSEKYFLPEIKDNAKAIRELHYVSNYRNLVARGVFSRIKAKLENFYDFKHKIRGYDKIVVLTEEDRRLNWHGNKKVVVIPNPVTFSSVKTSSLINRKIMTLGRLVHEKNQSSLIEAFSKVVNTHPDWLLEVYGEGNLREELQKQIDSMGLVENVRLAGVSANPQELYLNSSVFVLTSRFEGFGLVLLEAMECGVPVVSYDCPCGPKDIISDGKDGFLVSLGDEEMLAEKICFLIEHPEKRMEVGKAAKKKAENYSTNKITAQWMSLFNSLCANH